MCVRPLLCFLATVLLVGFSWWNVDDHRVGELGMHLLMLDRRKAVGEVGAAE